MSDAPFWLARGEAAVPAQDDWLTSRERERLAGFRFTKRRDDVRLARFTAKQTLARVLGWPSEPEAFARLEVRHHPSGAPWVHVDGAPSDLQISLTDRAGWAVCTVGAGLAPLGCDLELVEPRSRAFVDHHLTEAERAQWKAAAAPRRDLVANLIWCAKEGALKLLGTGLRRDARDVEVVLDGIDPAADPNGWERLEARVDGETLGGWHQRFGSFLLVCVANSAEPPLALEEPSGLDEARPSHSWLASPRANAAPEATPA